MTDELRNSEVDAEDSMMVVTEQSRIERPMESGVDLKMSMQQPQENQERLAKIDEEEQNYYTPYDGEDDFQCYIRLCPRNNAILRCFGVYGHDFPLAQHKGAAAEIAYEFMKNHPRH